MKIRCLIPDFPNAEDLLPYLKRLDQTRQYSNFGPLVQHYESHLAEISAAHCITLSSGTAALELAIAALKLPISSKVLLPSFSFPATVLAVLRSGLTPVFSDVDEKTWTLTPKIARMALKEHCYALILPVASFGLALPFDAWDSFTQETCIPVLMDAAPALGFQKTGKLTQAVFSLHATKPLGIGEGGLFATSDLEMAERVRCMSNFGFDQGAVQYPNANNSKLSEYAAAVGLAQLARWPLILARRQYIWKRYLNALHAIPGITTQPFDDTHPPAVFSVCLPKDSEKIAEELAKAGIETRRWYAPPLHLHPAFAMTDRVGMHGLRVTEHLYRHSLGLPFHTFLTDDDIDAVTNNLQTLLRTP